MGCPGGRPFFVSQEIVGGESRLRKTALLKKRAGKGWQKKIRGKCLNICAYYVILVIRKELSTGCQGEPGQSKRCRKRRRYVKTGISGHVASRTGT